MASDLIIPAKKLISEVQLEGAVPATPIGIAPKTYLLCLPRAAATRRYAGGFYP
jgi:hypothetical protein